MANEDGTIRLVFNGEIYNFRELREQLYQRGHEFRSQSDTEVVIHAYEEWGEKSIDKLNGMFSFAIFDETRNRIFLARDRFGEKPLYYFHHNDVFAFASELKAFAVCPYTPLSIVFDHLFQYTIFGYSPYPQTFFEHTFKLPPAHCMVMDLTSQEVRIEKYWDEIDACNQPIEYEGTKDLLAGLDKMVTEAVDLRLVADVPIGAFLSGGIDSSLIVGIMSKLRSRVKTFSIGFWDEEYDEAPYAKAIAEYLGCEHNEFYVKPEEALEVLVEMPEIYDEPFADSSAVPTFILSRFAREQVKVVLTGDGGDELFGGYDTYPYMALAPLLSSVPQALRGLLEKSVRLGGWGRVRRHADLFRQDEPWELFLYLNERTITKRTDACRLLRNYDPSVLQDSVFFSAFKAASALGPVNASLYTDAKTYLVDDILTKVDRASMAVSLEARVPFLDFRIAEFAIRLSEREKMGFRRQEKKRLLRSLLTKYVPRELFERPKRGFSIPLKSWFRNELRCLLDEYLDLGKLRREGLFDVNFVKQLKQEHLSGTRDREAVLWALVFWEMWRAKWKV